MKNNNEYVIYEGTAFTIEWYFDTKQKSQPLEYYHDLSVDKRIQFLKLVKRIGDAGEVKDKTKFRNEGDKIYAFKPQPDRYLCFFVKNKKIIVTNAFRKKQDKLPKKEKVKAIKYKDDYLNREKSGDYYE